MERVKAAAKSIRRADVDAVATFCHRARVGGVVFVVLMALSLLHAARL